MTDIGEIIIQLRSKFSETLNIRETINCFQLC
jgi:hypothetical protein